jgi:hypothetical protein
VEWSRAADVHSTLRSVDTRAISLDLGSRKRVSQSDLITLCGIRGFESTLERHGETKYRLFTLLFLTALSLRCPLGGVRCTGCCCAAEALRLPPL